MLDGASRLILYALPFQSATDAFYTLGDRHIVASNGSMSMFWEASSPKPESFPHVCSAGTMSLFCSTKDGALCKVSLVDEKPKLEVLIEPHRLGYIPGYLLQTQPCTTTPGPPSCAECQNRSVCVFRGNRFLPLDDKHGKPLIRDGRSYPLIFWKDDAGPDIIQSIKVRVTYHRAAV